MVEDLDSTIFATAPAATVKAKTSKALAPWLSDMLEALESTEYATPHTNLHYDASGSTSGA
jgi:hypothetical protein